MDTDTNSVTTRLSAETQMNDAEKRKKWDELRADWGERLVQQYPSGLPAKPDFRKDHLACSKWVTEALSVYTPQAMVWDLPPLHVASGKNYPDFMNLTLDEQCEIAESTFADAADVWELAKTAANARTAKENLEAQARAAVEEREAQERRDDDERLDEFNKQIAQIQIIEDLESMRDQLDNEVRESLRSNDYRSAGVARRQLLAVQTQAIAVQTQAIAIERKRSARNRRFARAAFIVAIVAIAFGLIAARFPGVLDAARKEAGMAVHAVEAMINKTPSSGPTALPK